MGRNLQLTPEKAPDGSKWSWEECARECALYHPCDYWTLQLNKGGRCILMSHKGNYINARGHAEGPQNLHCKEDNPLYKGSANPRPRRKRRWRQLPFEFKSFSESNRFQVIGLVIVNQIGIIIMYIKCNEYRKEREREEMERLMAEGNFNTTRENDSGDEDDVAVCLIGSNQNASTRARRRNYPTRLNMPVAIVVMG